MERTYFSINEEAAKQAWSMMSFWDYKKGSKTEEYRRMCDVTYQIAEEAIAARPEETERISSLAERYAKKLAENINKDSEIGCRCPSVMISGSGNFPVRKKEKQVAAWEKNRKEFEEIQKIRDRIRSIANGKDIIKSGDGNAIEKLEKKLEDLTDLQERMKATNRAIRLKDEEKGDGKLREMGYSDEDILALREPDFCGRIGYPDYALKNNNANIRSTRARLEALKREKDRGTVGTECEFFRMEENAEDMRIRLFFEGKPDAGTRGVLKSNGFRWSPKNLAWQRHLNEGGRCAVKRVIRELEEAAT